MQQFNKKHGEFISSVAGKTVELNDLTEQTVNDLFDELFAHYLDNEIIGTKVARVNADLYNAIVNGGLAVKEKGSTVGIDRNEIYMFKDFVIEGLPASLFQEGEIAYTYVPNIAKAFTGINTARTIESEDFDGVALQGAGKAGEFILDDNKLAVTKVTFRSEEH